MSENLLAFDLGTTGCKAVLADAKACEVTASAFARYETNYTADGGAEQQPSDWWAAAISACAQLRAQQPDAFAHIAGIGCGGMMNGLVAVDTDGEAVAPAIIHADVRGAHHARRLEREFGVESIFARTLNRPDAHLTLPKAMWLAESSPGRLKSAASIVQSSDYLASRLTGLCGFTDPSNASLTGGFDPVRREWAADLWNAAGIDTRLLPEIRPSTSVLGPLTDAAAAGLGLPSGIPVVVGGGDGACASAGSGVATGEAYCYLGGTSWIGLVTESPIRDSRLSAYCCLDERLTTFGTVQAAGSSVEWIGALIGGEYPDFAALDRNAAGIAPGSVRLFFLPYLQGERAPLWDDQARGVFFGLATHHGRPELYRSVLEGVAYALESIAAVFAQNGQALGEIRMLGGGASSALWTGILASVMDRTLSAGRDLSSATSLGAAMAAGVGVGCWPSIAAAATKVAAARRTEPDAGDTDAYRPLLAFWNTLYPAFRDRFEALAALGGPQ